MNNTRPRWLPRTKLTISLLMLGLVIFLLSRFSIVITPFILACILAYILAPIVNFIEYRTFLNRSLATGLIYLILVAGMVTFPAVLIPALADQIAGLNLDIQLILQQAEDLFAHQYVIVGQVIDGAAVFEQIIAIIQELFQPIFGETLNFAFDLLEWIVWGIFIFVVSFYLIKDSPALKKWAEQLPPPSLRKDALILRERINNIWAAFFRGQLLLATVVSIIFTMIGLIIGLPSPLAMGVFAGLLEFLPSVGHGIWLVIASLIAIFAGSTWMQVPNWVFALIIIGLHVVYQQFDLNYLIPRIIGRQVHLPPLVIILGIVAGAAMAGVLGIALAAPVIASARVIGRYIFANLFDTDPFPAAATTTLPPPNLRWWAVKRGKSPDKEKTEESETA